MITSKTPQPPALLIPWLTHQQSLTDKLRVVAGDARLDVLGQNWELLDAWDKTALKLDCEQVLHREIVMWAHNSPCWYARTILPIETYQANRPLFDRLQTESLGELIFNGTQIERVSLTAYTISPQSIEYAWLGESMHMHSPILWVRLSEFRVNGAHSFFLVEILLPGLLTWLS